MLEARGHDFGGGGVAELCAEFGDGSSIVDRDGPDVEIARNLAGCFGGHGLMVARGNGEGQTQMKIPTPEERAWAEKTETF